MSLVWRLVSWGVIGASLVVQVFALTALLDAWQLADTAWKPEFYTLGKYYFIGATAVAQNVGSSVQDFLGDTAIGRNIVMPCWWVHGVAVYAAAMLAIGAGTASKAQGGQRLRQMAMAGTSIIWPVAIAGLVLQGLQNQVVMTFFRENTTKVILYVATVFAVYAGANWVNLNVLDGPPVPGQEVELINDAPCPAPVNLDAADQVARIVSWN